MTFEGRPLPSSRRRRRRRGCVPKRRASRRRRSRGPAGLCAGRPHTTSLRTLPLRRGRVSSPFASDTKRANSFRFEHASASHLPVRPAASRAACSAGGTSAGRGPSSARPAPRYRRCCRTRGSPCGTWSACASPVRRRRQHGAPVRREQPGQPPADALARPSRTSSGLPRRLAQTPVQSPRTR